MGRLMKDRQVSRPVAAQGINNSKLQTHIQTEFETKISRRYECVTTMLVKIQASWNVTSCRLVFTDVSKRRCAFETNYLAVYTGNVTEGCSVELCIYLCCRRQKTCCYLQYDEMHYD
jgi:hypothetical protein